ncbi:tRNA uridine-5-carboxymethylaminomethyl(34) synthesis enzyme MnmG, partial [bacterium]|nr:tRNA uridine-5-carboxymethylaminomethyl(34) synthesis enzyme MnmG [bacterium]
VNSLNTLKEEVMEQAEVQIKYSGYISKEQNVADKIIRLEGTSIPADMNYTKLNSLSNESKEKLNFVKPTTIGQASRISGIKPTDINILLIYLGR